LIEHCTDIDPENSLKKELRRRRVTTYEVLRPQACFFLAKLAFIYPLCLLGHS